MKRIFLLILILWCSVQVLMADKSKQAIRALEKQDFEKAEEYLKRSYEADSLNPLVSFVYALYYVDTLNPNYDLDRSHHYISSGLHLLESINEDQSDEMEKCDVSTAHFDTLNLHVNMLAYTRAASLDEIESYEYFISEYAGASETLLAETRRNELAFAEAERKNTWQSYQDFLKRYPLSLQSSTAKERYNKLLHKEKTSSGRLDDLEQFLRAHPSSPYRSEVEAQIFDKRVAGLEEDEIWEFLDSYQNDDLTQKGLGLLYHSCGIDPSRLKSIHRKAYKHFMDSVRVLELQNTRVLYPFYKDGFYQFYDLEGKLFEDGPYEDISHVYFCGNVQEEILEVKKDGVYELINREGTVIYEGALDAYQNLGNGVLVISINGKHGAIRVTGEEILKPIYESIDLLDGRLLAFEQGGKTGLAGITGQVFLDPAYDEILKLGNFWVVAQGESYGVTNLKEILNDDPQISLPYEEVELIKEDYIVGYTSDFEALINEDLKVVTPDSTLSINTIYDIWTFRTDRGYYTFDQQTQSYSERIYEEVFQNYEWIGLLREETWVVFSKNMDSEPILGVDSLKLIGDDIAIVFHDREGLAIFPNRKVVEITEGQYIQALSSSRRTEIHYLAIEEQGKLVLYQDGERMFASKYEEIGFVSDSIFSVKERGKYGAVDLNGRPVLKMRYDAIAEAKNGVSDVLLSGEFGAYNFTDRVLLNIDYRERFQRYNESLFIVSGEDGYGLLSDLNEEVVAAQYQKIAYWNDSSLIGMKDNKWEIRRIYEDRILMEGVDGYQLLSGESTEKTIEVRQGNSYGVYHERLGMILPIVFSDVYNLGSPEKNLYMAEKVFPEADYYVVVYYDEKGQQTRSEAYRGKEYELIVCDD